MEVQSQFIEMFGNAPKIKLEDYISTQSGGTPNTKKQEYYEGGDIPWLSSGEINQGYIESTEKFITQKGLENSSAKWVPKDCVVIAMYGATAGKVGYIRIPLTTNQAVCSLLPCSEFNSIFLYYAVSQKSDWMISQCRGAAQPNISQGIIRSMELPLPPMEEQMKFVAIAELADKSKFVGFKSQFIEMFTDKGYPLTMIKSFADVSTGGTPSKAHPEYWNGDKPWVSAEDMKSKYVYDTCEKVTEAGYATCKIIPVDTLMYVCRGSIGVMAINKIECATNQSICRATCHNNVCNVEFLYHALMYQRDNIKKKGTGTSFKSLNQTTFSELEIELPPYDEQMKFVTIAEQADKSGFRTS